MVNQWDVRMTGVWLSEVRVSSDKMVGMVDHIKMWGAVRLTIINIKHEHNQARNPKSQSINLQEGNNKASTIGCDFKLKATWHFWIDNEYSQFTW